MKLTRGGILRFAFGSAGSRRMPAAGPMRGGRRVPPHVVGRTVALGTLAVASLALAACESTQSKSEQIAAELGPVKAEKGLEIDAESKDVEVLDTSVLTDANGTAVVVQVENTSEQTLADVPIAIEVLDAKGKTVYENDIPGLEPALTSIPLLMPGETLDWVHNQVLPIGEPDEVKARIGADAAELGGELPDIEVEEPSLENDAVSGINAAGVAVNNSGEDQGRLLVYGVARRGDEIVAAGRAAIDKLKADRQRTYHIYFIGDPKSAELSVASFPTLSTSQETEGDPNG